MFIKPLHLGNFSNGLWWWLQILSDKCHSQCHTCQTVPWNVVFFPWILLKFIIRLLSAESALLQYKEQN